MNLITLTEAKNLGLKFYFTGTPCSQNHKSTRYVSSRTCYECSLIRARKTNKESYIRNKASISLKNKSKYKNNKEDILSKNKEYYNVNKEYLSLKQSTSRYGITVDDYKDLQEKCNNKCQICGQEETKKHKNGKVHNLSIDHCHVTSKIRGLLCSQCNRGLGHFKDSTDLLLNAVSYLS